jgi:hypothetical protein
MKNNCAKMADKQTISFIERLNRGRYPALWKWGAKTAQFWRFCRQ